MNNQTQLVLSQSGYFQTAKNESQDSGTLQAQYVVNGNPASLKVTVEGLLNGDVAVLDTYTDTTSTTRSIALNGVAFHAFRFSAIFAPTNVSVAVSASTLGAGPTFNSDSLTAVQTYSAD